MSDDNARRSIGGNNPPSALDDVNPESLVDVEALPTLFEHHYGHLIRLRDERLAGIQRWMKAHTKELPDGTRTDPVILGEDDLRDVVDYKAQLAKFTRKDGTVDAIKARVKRSLIDAGKVTEAWFVDFIAGPIAEGHATIHRTAERYQLQREKDAEAARKEAARKAQAEAAHLAEMARRAESPLMRDVTTGLAEEAEERAAEAKAAAEASLVEASRIRGIQGSIGGLKSVWEWKEDNLMDLLKAIVAGEESIDLVTVNASLIRQLIGKPKYRRSIPGLSIYETRKGR